MVETLRKVLKWRRQLDAGKVATQADIARREALTRARVTQVLMLLRLVPRIQEHISPLRISERALRPITHIDSPRKQREMLEHLIS